MLDGKSLIDRPLFDQQLLVFLDDSIRRRQDVSPISSIAHLDFDVAFVPILLKVFQILFLVAKFVLRILLDLLKL